MLRHKIIKAKNKDLLCDLLWNLWLMSIDFVTNCCLPLREVVSWNVLSITVSPSARRLPLREVVSWNISTAFQKAVGVSLPLREVVSWNTIMWRIRPVSICLPLREVVSWNVNDTENVSISAMSTFAWGSELKYNERKRKTAVMGLPLREVVSWNISSSVMYSHLIDVYLCVR